MFATLALLHVGSEFAVSALIDTAVGLMLTADREAKIGVPPAYYGEHGLDRQRAYKIACLMIGSDYKRFLDLARRVMLPAERQETCEDDFELAKASWLSLLAPNLRRDSWRQMSFWERLSQIWPPCSQTCGSH